MDSLLLIANADAGSALPQGLDTAIEVLREQRDVEVISTTNQGELDDALHRAGSRTIVVAGGDGSLHAIISGLYRRGELQGRTIGLIPMGTGNDFARTLDVPLDPSEAAVALLKGTPRSMDLIVDELGGIVVNNVHIGASAQASRRGARWKSRLRPVGLGIVGYPIGALLSAVRPPFRRLRIEADGEALSDLSQHVLMVSIGNGTSVGGGTEVTPDADPTDGRLEVMVSFATGPLARFHYVWQLLKTEHTERDDVLTVRAQQVSVSGEDFYMAADGEISGPEKRRSWRLEPAAYSLIVP